MMKKPVAKKKMTLERLAQIVEDGFAGVNERFIGLESRIDEKIEKLAGMTANEFALLRSEMDIRFAQVDMRFAQIDERFIQIDDSFVAIRRDILGIHDVTTDHNLRLARLEKNST